MFEDCIPLKPRIEGTYTFFPDGTFSKKGYILNQEEAKWVRSFITASYSISMCIITIGIFIIHKYLLTLLTLLIVQLMYYTKIKRFIKDKPQVKERLQSFENIINMSKKAFILLILGVLISVFFVFLALIIIVKIDKRFTWESMQFLSFSILLFVFFLSIVMLKLRLQKVSNTRNKRL